jgi:RNA polymerase sigma-70 factor (ECF subfamily)
MAIAALAGVGKEFPPVPVLDLGDGCSEGQPVVGPAERLAWAFSQAREELVRALAGLLGDPDDAQDVAQEAFLKCWRRRESAGEVRDLKAWIFRVGLNAARDLRRNVWRRRSRSLAEADLPDRTVASPNQTAIYREALARFHAALETLRPEERDVFLLRHFRSLPYEDIAHLHHLPVGTVKTRMRAALGKLRKVFQE